MKVVTPGTLIFVAGVRTIAQGWVVRYESGEHSLDAAELQKAKLASILSYIAEMYGVSPQAELVTLDVERAALDAIAVARWTA